MRTHNPDPACRFAKLHFPHQLALVLFLVLLLAALFGCSRPPQPKTENLADKVKIALSSDSAAQREKIEVDANGGVVILKGRVANDDVKKRVQDIAQKVPGVKWVQTKVSVAPGSG